MMNQNMYEDIDHILLSREQIAEIVARLGRQISEDYAGKFPLLVCVLKGSLPFTADLMRQITIPAQLDFMAASSYQGTETSGLVKITKDVSSDIAGRHVILIEDILDTGVTLHNLLPVLKARGAASVALCVLCDKPERRKVPVPVDYCGTRVPNEFIVGYGLDYDEAYRNLPDIGVLKPEVYSR